MSGEQMSCVLCGSKAEVSEREEGNRKYVECSNPECGNYEISRAAENDIEQNAHVRQRLSGEAKDCRAAGEILRVAVGDDGNLIAACAAHPRE